MVAIPISPFEILLVEDEMADAHLVKTALKKGRVYLNISHVLDGVEAMQFLLKEGRFSTAVTPELILLDLNMPRMNGKEFLAAVKKDPRFNHIPVVVLTTSDVEKDIISSYQLGASGFITKPVDMLQFFEAVRQLEEYWFTLVRLPTDRADR